MKQSAIYHLGDEVKTTRPLNRYNLDQKPDLPQAPGIPTGTVGMILDIWESHNTEALYLLGCEYDNSATIPVLAHQRDLTLHRRPRPTAVNNAQNLSIDQSPTATVRLPVDHYLQRRIAHLAERIGETNSFFIASVERACRTVINNRPLHQLDPDEREILTLFERVLSEGPQQAVFCFSD
jgi:hypothetical protein